MLSFKKRRYFIIYSIVFCCLALIIIYPFDTNGISLVRDDDAFRQHLKALIYISEWLRSSLSQILHGNFSISTWSFSLGYGNDILTSLHYYGIGEPLNLLSVFVPAKQMVLFYEIMIFVRMYLAGLCFSAFTAYMKKNTILLMPLVAGSMAYVFCGYMILYGFNHPFFITPFILFPLLLLGIERELREEKPVLFIIAVFLSGICNFYNFYILIIVAFLYYLVRYIRTDRNLTQSGRIMAFCKQTGRFLIFGSIGVLMASCILVPVITAFLSDSRAGNNLAIYSFYLPRYYRWFLSGLMSIDFNSSAEYAAMGFGAAIIPCVIYTFLQIRKHPKRACGFACLTLALLVPFFGWASNGFTYVVNRWLWALALLAGYLIAVTLPDLLQCTLRQKLIMSVLCICYILVCTRVIGTTSTGIQTQSRILITLCIIMCIFIRPDVSFYKAAVPIISIVAIIGTAANPWHFLTYDHISVFRPQKDFYTSDTDRNATLSGSDFWQTDARIISSLGDHNTFYRYTSYDPNRHSENASVLYNESSTQYYWSLSNGNVSRFMTELAVTDPLNMSDCYHGLDDRTALNALADVKYYVTEDPSVLPYGYNRLKGEQHMDKTDYYQAVYENQYTLPFAYTYEQVCPYTLFENLSPLKKQQVMLHATVIKDSTSMRELPVSDFPFADYDIPFTMTCEKGCSRTADGQVAVNDTDASVLLTFDPVKEQETYLFFEKLMYSGTPDPTDRNWREPDAVNLLIDYLSPEKTVLVSKKLPYYTDYFKWTKSQHDYLVNSAYRDSSVSYIRIHFSTPGTYSWDSLSISGLPMTDYADQIISLQKDPLSGLKLHDSDKRYITNTITAQIILDQEKLLCFSIPFHKGWSAIVDGETQELHLCNLMYTGLILEAGSHEITLVYHTPGLRTGLLLSAAGLFLLILIGLKTGFHRRTT